MGPCLPCVGFLLGSPICEYDWLRAPECDTGAGFFLSLQVRGIVSGGMQDGGMVRRAGGGGGGGAGGAGVKAARRPEVRLPALESYDGFGLEPDGDYDGLEFREVDFIGQDGGGARFMDCALTGCALDETRLHHARVLDSVLTGIRGVGTDLAESTLRDVELVDARLGGVQLHGSVLERVLVRGGKIDYLNLRKARLKDVVFEGCVLVEPDFGGARLERVEFVGCVLKGRTSRRRRLRTWICAGRRSWTSRGGWTGWRGR